MLLVMHHRCLYSLSVFSAFLAHIPISPQRPRPQPSPSFRCIIKLLHFHNNQIAWMLFRIQANQGDKFIMILLLGFLAGFPKYYYNVAFVACVATLKKFQFFCLLCFCPHAFSSQSVPISFLPGSASGRSGASGCL